MRIRIHRGYRVSVMLAVWGMGCSADQDLSSNPPEPNPYFQSRPNPNAPPHFRGIPGTVQTDIIHPEPPPDASVAEVPSVPPRPCTKDDECLPGFCDRTTCAMPGKGNFGREDCEPEPPEPPPPPLPPGMKRGTPSFAMYCGEYHCIDRRCRSCLNDAECEPGLGLVCVLRGDFPGRACERVLPQKPALSPPPAPKTTGPGAGTPAP